MVAVCGRRHREHSSAIIPPIKSLREGFWMRFYYKLLSVLLIVLGLGLPMVLKGPDGHPIMSVADWMPEVGFFRRSLQQLQSSATDLTPEPALSPTFAGDLSTTVLRAGELYQWQDRAGGWHFSDQKPQIESQLTVEALPQVKNLISAPVVRPATSSKLSSTGTVSDITRSIQ